MKPWAVADPGEEVDPMRNDVVTLIAVMALVLAVVACVLLWR
jgi:hypothetical protein